MTRPATLDKHETATLIASDKVEGTHVYRSNGDNIGSIERIMIDKISGQVAYAVMSFGGFLGIGHDHYPVPWSLLTYNTKLGGYEVNLSDAQFAAALKHGREQGLDWENVERSLLAGDPVVERALRHAIDRLPEIVRARRKELTESNIEALVDVYLADDPIAEARASIEADNARERARFLADVPCLTSRQVAEHAGHQAANTSVTASRWKQQGKIFSIPWKGSELYPAFQFRDGQPHPGVAKVLGELPERLSPWQTAFWFVSSNGWLRGAAPAERLDDEAAIIMAARRENEPIAG